MKKHKKKNELVSFDFDNANENIVESNVADQAEEWQKICGANKNLYRYIPSLIDGLKPVQRRFMYMMYKEGYYNNNYIKMSVGMTNTVMIHPHGDQNIGDVVLGMAVDWKNNIPVVDIPANKGSESGTQAASPRYLEVSISKFGYECYFDNFKNSNVEMSMAYTGKMEEPEYLPSKYPIAIVNGGFSGIGYGLASNIPMFNFKEVCETTIQLMKDPKAKVCITPDSPSGADIVMTKKQIKDLFELGISTLTMRAVPEIDYIHNIITFVSIPVQVTTKMINDAIVKLRLNGKLDEIIDMNDHTSELNGVYYEILLKKDANPEKVLEKLYKLKTNLSKGYSASITLIDDYQDDTYSVRRFLLTWIEYRRDTLRSSFNARLIDLEEKRHMNSIKILVIGGKNGEKTIKMSESSKNKQEYIKKLIDSYNITSLQASTIADLATYAFTEEYYNGCLKEEAILKREITEIRSILEADGNDMIDSIIEKELQDGIKKYGETRRSRVFSPDDKIVENMDVVVGISEDGFIKKIKREEPVIGSIGKQSGSLNMVISSDNNSTLFIFDDRGMMHIIPVNSIPLMKPKKFGMPIERYTKIEKEAKIISTTLAPKISDVNENHGLIMVTKNGYVKRINLMSIINNKKTLAPSVKIMALTNDDKLASVNSIIGNSKDIIIFTNLGDGIRLDIEDIPTQLPGAKGVKSVMLRNTEVVIGTDMIHPNDKYLVYVTSSGKVKRTDLKMFPVMKRKDELLPLVGLDSGESLVSIISIFGDEKLRFHKKISDPEVINCNEIPITSRIAKASKMIKVPRGDTIVSIVKLN